LHPAGELIEYAASETSSVVLQNEGLAVRALAACVCHVLRGERRPAALQLDTDRAAVLMDPLDERGRDPAQRVEDEITGVALGGNHTPRDLGQHLRWVTV